MKAPPDASRFLWQSLDDWAVGGALPGDVAAEFPVSLDVWDDGVSRRRFLQLMGASMALAGVLGGSLGGCVDRNRPEKIVPYVHHPEGMTPGRPMTLATAVLLGGYAMGVMASCREGRPVKLEGNPGHPSSLGSSDAVTQAQLLTLYDPDRSRSIMHGGRPESWERFSSWFRDVARDHRAGGGAGLMIVSGNTTSPTELDQMARLRAVMPAMRWVVHDPAGGTRSQRGLGVYHPANASVVLLLGSDLMMEEPGSVRYARDLSDRRRVRRASSEMSRVYAVETMPSATGSFADHRLRLRASRIESFAGEIASRLGVRVSGGLPGSGAPPAWIDAVASDLLDAGSKALVVPGRYLSERVHRLAEAINARLGAVGSTVHYVEHFDAAGRAGVGALADAAQALGAGEVETLVVLGTNPVYSAPGGVDLAAAISRAGRSVHLGLARDETGSVCDWHVHALHDLERFGDARGHDGTATLIQPAIAPLYEGHASCELLEILLGRDKHEPREIVDDFWRRQTGLAGASFEKWRWRALREGFIEGSEAPAIDGPPRREDAIELSPRQGGAGLELEVRPDSRVWDGSLANNAWLQELPKPVTKLTWDNAVLLSPATAQRLGLANGRRVRLETRLAWAEGAVWIVPGHADGAVSVQLGYGRTMAGRVGDGCGFNAYRLMRSSEEWSGVAVTLTALEGRTELASTQRHQRMEHRHPVRHGDLGEFRADPGSIAARGERAETAGARRTLLPLYEYRGHKWGMSIDLTACMGCGACTAACQAENNIPVVGKGEVLRQREMHWIRVDRYFHGDPGEPEILHQPIPCMHCEDAPCEVVCPVGATVHSSEGLNQMVYNRCIGTRYCSNNCPYKVRRFNFLQYGEDDTDSLMLARNPEVTVRSRGVMEKCTYCVQRIEHARIDAINGGDPITDGSILTACQQACPTRAIEFGDLNDETARVKRLHDEPHAYGLLEELGTRPRTRYLSCVKNTNRALAGATGREEGIA